MTVTPPTFAQRVGSAALDAPQPTCYPQLKDIIKSLPKEVFQKNPVHAWTSVLISVLAVVLGYGAITFLPWYCLPLAWIWTGTALTGWFVIAHDCGHRSFAKRRWVNDWVGHLLMAPLIYPFHSWRLLHDRHHFHTNKLLVDNAWHPWLLQEYQAAHPLLQQIYRGLRGYFWWLASIVHWAVLHFDLSQFAPKDRGKVKLSISVVALFAAVFFPTLFLTTGAWGVCKFWLMPWLVYHFWMSTFTLVHHTDPQIPFQPAELWHAGQAQLTGTVHCSYPRWVEILCHNINVHVPHHISVAIPSYNLPAAHASLKQSWGSFLQERRFSWAMMKTIVDRCHLYHPEAAYQSFQDGCSTLGG
jgi:omega-6 fatty acid desaturase (delta-12 desaturase)